MSRIAWGQAVEIDPVSGRIWFGRKALDIARQMRAEGIDRPFYCVRVGSDYYSRKRGRWSTNPLKHVHRGA